MGGDRDLRCGDKMPHGLRCVGTTARPAQPGRPKKQRTIEDRRLGPDCKLFGQLGAYVGVVFHFVADGGFGAVAGYADGFGREAVDDFAQGAGEGGRVASG